SIQIVVNDRGNHGSGGALSDSDTINITVNPVNDAPVVTTTPGALTYTENDAAAIVDANVSISDTDGSNLAGATITIASGYVAGQDVLAFVNQNGITGSFNAATGVLTLSGVTSIANYQAALRSITYVNTSENPSSATRTIQFAVRDDGNVPSA